MEHFTLNNVALQLGIACGFCEETLKLSWLTCSHETSHAFTTSAKTNLGETGGSAQGAGKERGNFYQLLLKWPCMLN